MSRYCRNLGCAVLSANVVGGGLEAYAGQVADLVSRIGLPGTLSAMLEGHGSLSAFIAQGVLSAVLGDRARVDAAVVGQAVLIASVVCEIGARPYLEIDPTVIWLVDWGADNDVLSNTYWNVN